MIKMIQYIFKFIIKIFYIFIFSLFIISFLNSSDLANHSKIDKLYENENFNMIIIFNKDAYKIKEIFLIVSYFDEEEKFKMSFDGKIGSISIDSKKLKKKEFYYFFEVVTKDNRTFYYPENIEERMKNIVSFIKENKEKKEGIIILLPQDENRLDVENFIFSIYLKEGTKDVRIMVDGEDVTEKCIIGKNIVSYAPEKIFKPARYRFDVIKEQVLLKTYHFQITRKRYFKKLFNGNLSTDWKIDLKENKIIGLSFLLLYGNLKNFYYRFEIFNTLYPFDKKLQKFILFLNYDDLDMKFGKINLFNDFLFYRYLPLDGVGIFYNNGNLRIENILGNFFEKRYLIDNFSFEKIFNFYLFNTSLLFLKDDTSKYLNLNFGNFISIFGKRLNMDYRLSSKFFNLGNLTKNTMYDLGSFSQIFKTDIDFKYLSSTLNILKISSNFNSPFKMPYNKMEFKNSLHFSNEISLTGDYISEGFENGFKIFQVNKQRSHFFKFLFLFNITNIPGIYFDIARGIFDYDSLKILKISTGFFYQTHIEENKIFYNLQLTQTNYDLFFEKRLLTDCQIDIKFLLKKLFKAGFVYSSSILEYEMEKVLNEKYGCNFEILKFLNFFKLNLSQYIFIKKEFDGLKKRDLIFLPEFSFSVNLFEFKLIPEIIFNTFENRLNFFASSKISFYF